MPSVVRRCSMSVTRCEGALSLTSPSGVRPPGSALIEDHDSPVPGIEEPAVHLGGAGARTAMQEQRRHTARVTRLLPVQSCDGHRAAGCPSGKDRSLERGHGGSSSRSQSKSPGGDYIGVKSTRRVSAPGAGPRVPSRLFLQERNRLRHNLIGFLLRLCREPRATDVRTAQTALLFPLFNQVEIRRCTPKNARTMHRICTTPGPSLCCYGTSPPSHSGKHPLLPRTQSVRVADRVILLPADAAAPSALGIFRPRHAAATAVQQPPPDGLQRDRRHGNAMPSLSVRFRSSHGSRAPPPADNSARTDSHWSATWSRPGDANHQQSCASRHLIR